MVAKSITLRMRLDARGVDAILFCVCYAACWASGGRIKIPSIVLRRCIKVTYPNGVERRLSEKACL